MAERPFSTASGDILTLATNTPLPVMSDDSTSFREPRAPYMASVPFTSASPRESYLNATPNNSGTLLATKNENYIETPIFTTTSPTSKRRSIIVAILSLVALLLIITAVIVPVYFIVIKPHSNHSKISGSGSGSGSGSTSGGPSTSSGSSSAITGGDGSVIRAADGSTFTYNNKFGGFCKCSLNCNLCPT